MSHEEIAPLLGAYALDAVDDDERALVEAHLAECARCRAEVQEHREVATFLAHGGSDAPEGLWQRIAESLEEAPPGLRLVPGPPGPAGSPPVPVTAARRRPVRALAAALAAAAVVVVALLGLQVRQQDQRIDELQVALSDPLSPAFSEALADPSSQVIELTSADGETVLRGVVADDGTGYLRADALPTLDRDRTYQLWGDAGGQLVSLGVLGAHPRTVTFAAASYDAFAITEEAAPGVVVSGQPPVVAGHAV
jgi:hypothetical protein